MAGKLISQGTATTPASTDMIPLGRPGDTSARYATVGTLLDTWAGHYVKVDDYGALGDGSTDDIASIQAAIDAGVLLSNTYGQSRIGRLVVHFTPGKIYRTTAPIDLCDKQGIMIDGGAPNFGATILCEATGKAAIEIVGSQNICLQNIQIYGHQTNKPSAGVFVSRSTATHGSNGVQITFRNVVFSGYYANTCYYAVETESNHFYECLFYPVDVGNSVVYLAKSNVLSLTPDNATLLGGGYGLYNINFYNCAFSSAADATTIYCNEMDTHGLTVRDSYIYGNSTTYPTIVVDGSGVFTLDNVLFEGSPSKRISVEYKAGAANYFFATLRDITWGGEQDYLLYAEDNTDLRSYVFDGRHNQSAYSGAYAGVSVYNARMCDFRGLGYYQGDVMDITVRNISAGCLYRLGPDDTVTFSSQNIGSIIENQLTETTGTLKLESDLELGPAWYGGHLILGTYHIWVDSTGDLRIKSSAPTSDTDGTIVGTQS